MVRLLKVFRSKREVLFAVVADGEAKQVWIARWAAASDRIERVETITYFASGDKDSVIGGMVNLANKLAVNPAMPQSEIDEAVRRIKGFASRNVSDVEPVETDDDRVRRAAEARQDADVVRFQKR